MAWILSQKFRHAPALLSLKQAAPVETQYGWEKKHSTKWKILEYVYVTLSRCFAWPNQGLASLALLRKKPIPVLSGNVVNFATRECLLLMLRCGATGQYAFSQEEPLDTNISCFGSNQPPGALLDHYAQGELTSQPAWFSHQGALLSQSAQIGKWEHSRLPGRSAKISHKGVLPNQYPTKGI